MPKKKKIIRGGYDEKTAEYYHKEFEKLLKEYSSARWLEKSLELIKKLPLKRKRALDAGCGFGHTANFLFREGAEVFGVDASPRLIDIAKEKYLHLAENLIVGDIRKLPFKKDSFDFIISQHTIHYLESPNEAFEEFSRCLRKNGGLIFSVHHPMSVFHIKKLKFPTGSKDYFKKEKIRVRIFEGVDVQQPTHPLTDYLSEYFLKHFDLELLEEDSDYPKSPARSKVPQYLLIKARKR